MYSDKDLHCGFPEQTMVGGVPRFNEMYGMHRQPRRLSKSEIISILCEYLSETEGVTISKVVKIDETPSTIRHSCLNTGVLFLDRFVVTIPVRDSMVSISYYLCKACGKLFVYNDFI